MIMNVRGTKTLSVDPLTPQIPSCGHGDCGLLHMYFVMCVCSVYVCVYVYVCASVYACMCMSA